MDCLPQIHVAALHASPGYRTATPGVGVLCAEGELRGGVGAYQNSNGVGSVYAMAAWVPLTLGPVNAGLMGGGASGYEGGGVKPLAGAVLEIPFSWGAAYLLLTPKHDGNKPAALGLSFTIKFQGL